MAHDAYARASDLHGYDHLDTRNVNPQSYYTSDEYKSRSRQSSRDRGDLRPPQEQPKYMRPPKPIDEAVNTAFDNAHLSGINPDLIAQITQNVIQQLKTTGDTATPLTATRSAFPPPPPKPNTSTQHFPPPSPSPRSGGSPPVPSRTVYTPPSPQKHSEHHDIEPDSPQRGAQARTENSSPDSYPKGPSTNTDYTSNSTREPEEKRPPSRISMSSDTREIRPKAPERISTAGEETTLEKIWGPLFDDDGKPTPRLGQFLRGLAVHLIEDYEPKQSLVVTPIKMAKFYESTRILKEKYPWNVVFDDSQSSISRMYRQLRIQHHLVQEDNSLKERPDIPGLTPRGFERWITLMILGHPDEEFERLQKAAVNMPINNPEDKKERFPKDISRRLFPKREKIEIREHLIDAMEQHAKITVERPLDTPTPRAEQQQHHQRRPSETASHHSFTDASVTSEPPYVPGNLERERKPYSRIPNESAIDDTNPPLAHSISTPIERERKPYSAAPRGTARFDDVEGRTPIPNPTPHPAPPPSGPLPGLTRSISNASRPVNIPPPPPGGPAAPGGLAGHRMSMSTTEFTTPQTNPAYLQHRESVRRRGHSPNNASMGANDFRRSDGDVRFQPGSYEQPSYMATREGQPYHPDPRYEDETRRYGREGEIRRGEYVRGGSPSRRGYEPPKRKDTYNEEDYYRTDPRRDNGGRNW